MAWFGKGRGGRKLEARSSPSCRRETLLTVCKHALDFVDSFNTARQHVTTFTKPEGSAHIHMFFFLRAANLHETKGSCCALHMILFSYYAALPLVATPTA